MAADPITTSTVDDLLDFNFSDAEDPFGDASLSKTRDDKPTLSPRAAKRKLDEDKENLGLGLDEEVKITKKRRPIVKLDEARLLTELGIPRLRTLARSGKPTKKLGFKGKGHEFSDVARLLNYYQLWLDGLYPRAKFADGLQLIEKAGHSKRMNLMRKEWIDEGKPGYIRRFEHRNEPSDETEQPHTSAPSDHAGNVQPEAVGEPDDLFFVDDKPQEKDHEDAGPDDDELDALLAGEDVPSKPVPPPDRVESEGEDDLDALLAEQESRTAPVTAKAAGSDMEDDQDALLAEREGTDPSKEAHLPSRKRGTIFDDDDDDEDEDEDDDDLDALLAEQEAGKVSKMTSAAVRVDNLLESEPPVEEIETSLNVFSSSPLPNNPEEEDDLDALLAEHEASR